MFIIIISHRRYSVGDSGISCVRASFRPSGAITQKPQYQLPSNFTHVFLTTGARHGANFDFRKSTVTDWRPFLLLAMHYHNKSQHGGDAGLHCKHHVYASSAVGNHSRPKLEWSTMFSHAQPWSAAVVSHSQLWSTMVRQCQAWGTCRDLWA